MEVCTSVIKSGRISDVKNLCGTPEIRIDQQPDNREGKEWVALAISYTSSSSRMPTTTMSIEGRGEAAGKTPAKKKAAYMVLVRLMKSAGICEDEWENLRTIDNTRVCVFTDSYIFR